jgi:hypothetical protein
MHKWGTIIAWALRAMLLIALVNSGLHAEWDNVFILGTSFVGSVLVYAIGERAFGLRGYWMDVLFALLLVDNNLLGLVYGFYQTVPGWDIATHFTTSLFLAVSALTLAEQTFPVIVNHKNGMLVVIGILLFSLGLGALWEMGEFLSDFFRGTTFQGGLLNTMQDLMVDGIAGLLVGITHLFSRPK